MPAVLHLNLHRELCAQIVAGTKRMEYRRPTTYLRRRLKGFHYDLIRFRNSYTCLPLNPLQFDLMSFREIAAALTAFGFTAKKGLLAQLLARNHEVAGKIKKGSPVTAPGVPKNYPDAKKLVTKHWIRPS